MHSPLNKLLAAIMLFLPLGLSARKVKITHRATPVDTVMPDRSIHEVKDTVRLAAIILSGYDKRRDSTRESIFVTNGDSLPLVSIDLNIEYLTTDGRQLHRRQVRLNCSVPPGETRRLDYPSWDKQHTFYYFRSPAPRRSQAVPYDVRFSVTGATLKDRDK